MPFAATWMDLEIITLSEVRKRQIPYDTTYVWNLKYLKYDKNEPMCKTETDLMDIENRLVVSKGKGVEAGMK